MLHTHTHTYIYTYIHTHIYNTCGVLHYCIRLYLPRDHRTIRTVILIMNRFIIYLESIAAREGVEGEGHKYRYRDCDESNGNNGVLAGLEAVVV